VKRIERFKFIGIDTERATLILSTLNDLMATYHLHRQWITAPLADGNGGLGLGTAKPQRLPSFLKFAQTQ
jgi:hypothetical protein